MFLAFIFHILSAFGFVLKSVRGLEMAQWLRIWSILLENLCSFPSTHMGQLLLPVTPVVEYLISATALCRHPHMCCIHSCISTHLHKWFRGKRGMFDQNTIYACMRLLSNKK